MTVMTNSYQERLLTREMALTNSYQESIQAEGKDQGEVVVSVKNVSKKFCRNLKRSMAYGIIDLAKNLVGIKPDSTQLRRDEFWALNDISFELRRGEAVGLIGVNGSGKTTLLRLIAGIFPPDKGEIMIKGRVGALIAVGAGFHGYMTGRENIYLNGSILGMSREEIDAKFQDIVDFAEIGDFLDAPVSTYSSGMRVRLGFSIATAIEPDVLLLDEILAVGDRQFRVKCFNRVGDLQNNCGILFVSHAMPQISRICTSVIVLDCGKIIYNGETADGIRLYNSLYTPEHESFVKTQPGFHLNNFEISKRRITWKEDLQFQITFTSNVAIDNCKARVVVYDESAMGVAEWQGENHGRRYNVRRGKNVIKGCLSNLNLRDEKYSLTFVLSPSNGTSYLVLAHCYRSFIVTDGVYGHTVYQI